MRTSHRTPCGQTVAVFVVALLASAPAFAQTDSILFESGPVRPVALAPGGTRLFVANIPDAHLEVFDVAAGALAHVGSIPVGLEPVAVAAVSDDEVWVVNHLSDSVSVVDVPGMRVRRTLLVGDEPRDIVVARGHAFITTAHRGQHRTHPSLASVPGAGDPGLTTPGVGRADVWIFDVNDDRDALGGLPVRIVTLFGDTPRALAVADDGQSVYAAVFHSGNGTTTVSEGMVCDGFEAAAPCNGLPGGNPGPSTNAEGAQAPEVGLIVKHDPVTGRFEDELGRDFSAAVRFELPDYDVFQIETTSGNFQVIQEISGVGTTLFNMVAGPSGGPVYVSNTESRNEVRFEGPGNFGGSTVQGHLAEARITILDGGAVTPRHLNSHIDYGTLPAPAGVKDPSLATPVDMALSADGSTLYVAAFGSARIGVLDTAALAAGSFDPVAASDSYLSLSGGGPSGLALDEAQDRLYVLTRFDNTVSSLDLTTGTEAARVAMHTPEPAAVVDGRRFLYDATYTSSNGEASCASCHIFGDMDHLAWDLGNPDDIVTTSSIPIELGLAAGGNINGTGNVTDFHPMKGPMTTQTLRGMAHSGAMHWRGDRSTGLYGDDALDEDLSFRNFNAAIVGLVGRDRLLTDGEMQAFADFALAITMPPNPVRSLDNSLSNPATGPSQLRGKNFYVGPRLADGVPGFGFTCEGCHRLDPAEGFFGTGGHQSFENEPQILKIAQLRNLYQKVGMFGMPAVPFFNAGNNGSMGLQVRGFGFLHDGSVDTVFRFLGATVFNPTASAGFDGGDPQRRDVEAFLLAYDSDLAPIVGQQVSVTSASPPADVSARIDLLIARAEAPFVSAILGPDAHECDLVAKLFTAGGVRGFVYRPASGLFEPDDGSGPRSRGALLSDVADPTTDSLVLTCAPPGSGARMGVDRDGDGALDAADNCPAASNAGQADEDGDGIGDACDLDFVPSGGPDAGPDAGVGSDAGTPPGDASPPGGDGGGAGGGGGCGCRTASPSDGTPAVAILGLLALFRLRRRRG